VSPAVRNWSVILAILVCVTAGTAYVRFNSQELPRPTPAAQKLDPPHVVRTVKHVDKYTYLELMDAPDSSYWIAGPHIEVQVGDQVAYSGTHEMRNFHSPTLGVTFDRILFVDLVHAITADGRVVAGSDHSHQAPLRPEAAVLSDSVAPDFDPRQAPPAKP
jgi:hypothetical protein